MAVASETCPKYLRPHPALKSQRIERDPEAFHASQKEFDSGEPLRALASLVRYLDPSLKSVEEFANGSHCELPHGSATIHLRNRDGQLSIECPFVRLTDKGRVAALRKCAELNMDPLTLVQISLEGSDLMFRFECPVEDAHPDKILDCLREVASCADHFDDLFVEKFSAVSLAGSAPGEHPAPLKAEAFDLFQSLVRESLEHLRHGEQLQQIGFCLDIAFIAFFRIADVVRPQGYLRSAIGEILRTLYAEKNDGVRIEKAKKQLEEFSKMDLSKFGQSIYPGRFSIPLAREYSFADACNFVEHYYSYGSGYLRSGDAMAATTCLYSCFTILLGRFLVPAGVEAHLREALEESAGQPWRESAETLLGAADQLLSGSEEEFEEVMMEEEDAVVGGVALEAMMEQMTAQMTQQLGPDFAKQMAVQAEVAQKVAMEAMKNMQKMMGIKDPEDKS